MLFGFLPGPDTVTAIFSVRLDEVGKDRRPHVIVAGGVGTLEQWSDLEQKWDRLMKSKGIGIFHKCDFDDRKGDFENWGDLKCRNLIKAQEKAIRNCIPFTIAVAVEKKTHAKVKKAMQNIRHFKADSDYGLCFRVIRFLVCQKIAKQVPKAKVQFLLEQGPDAADASVIYEDIRRTIGAKYRPAMYAEMLNGFASSAKGQFRSLEAADYLAGRAMEDFEAGHFLSTKRGNQISMLMDEEFLTHWHEDMIKAREHRRAHYINSRSKPSSSDEQAS
ncbi:hypothetical protein HYPDE_28108 [Hyphomicrobium denitrificans 1NES1]|uniref:DUF3800 domain-containing protein n=1 Tax=Hyphomicrobium denitrificans 1NES1 TaxID=670307 RepID=N0B9S7_9HYPH|nr:hypothetical protein HYPDE_28108 [Hyphomicrobium denitrificans 1NES1]